VIGDGAICAPLQQQASRPAVRLPRAPAAQARLRKLIFRSGARSARNDDAVAQVSATHVGELEPGSACDAMMSGYYAR